MKGIQLETLHMKEHCDTGEVRVVVYEAKGCSSALQVKECYEGFSFQVQLGRVTVTGQSMRNVEPI